ncbi:hypothetical protein TI39_contig4114g00014 [Zymoseptoria brevis]|uniref:Uncharacterized protein n=1 Tax=Zymoseptoria brevis TaxID=1047168 RepID=A0A0F4GDJ9_9PEZI|nr:hypothetical protein TI39_contig4114g00014 [Zymoseptoria brevis]
MMFSNILVCACAFAAISSAQTDRSDATWINDAIEFVTVIGTATFPAGLVQDALTRNSDALIADLESAFSPGAFTNQFSWVTALPSDLSRFLDPHDTVTAYGAVLPEYYGFSGAAAISAISVFESALPATLLLEALTDEDAYNSHIDSIFDPDATTYPPWASALPSDILTYFDVKFETAAAATALMVPQQTSDAVPGTTVQASAITVTSTTLASITKPPSATTTATQTTGGTTATTTGGGGGDIGGDLPGGAAAMPMVGMGAVILVGVVGLLAL